MLALCPQTMLHQQPTELLTGVKTPYSQPSPKKPKRQTALCWSCKNATALKCNWVLGGERVWSQATEHTVNYSNNSTLFTVTECRQYEKEEERLTIPKAW